MCKTTVEIDFIDYMNEYWVHVERANGTYRGQTYYKAPKTIAYTDTYDEAVKIASKAREVYC